MQHLESCLVLHVMMFTLVYTNVLISEDSADFKVYKWTSKCTNVADLNLHVQRI